MNGRTVFVALLSFMCAAVSGVAAERQHQSISLVDADRPLRSLSAIQMDVHAALRAEASSRRLGANVPEVVRLIDLYRELALHPKRDKSEFLAQLALRVRTRLETVRNHIERGFAADRAAKKKQNAPTVMAPKARVLAQQIAGPGIAPGQGGQPAGVEGIDYGPELVDLIQRTISPATWDVNGGNGSVVYFAPRHAIVVSAPQAVHEKVGDVLGQLRAAP
jgi:hypothetical protein